MAFRGSDAHTPRGMPGGIPAGSDLISDQAEPPKPNGVNGSLGLADKENTSRAGSEAPEKPEKQPPGAGEHPVRRGRAPGVRRPDVMRKAEQAILRLVEIPLKSTASAGSY